LSRHAITIAAAPAPPSRYAGWFKPAAFGGSNYSRTPAGVMSHVNEPRLAGINRTAVWMTLWHIGRPLGIASLLAKDVSVKLVIRSMFNQTNGDPLVAR